MKYRTLSAFNILYCHCISFAYKYLIYLIAAVFIWSHPCTFMFIFSLKGSSHFYHLDFGRNIVILILLLFEISSLLFSPVMCFNYSSFSIIALISPMTSLTSYLGIFWMTIVICLLLLFSLFYCLWANARRLHSLSFTTP